jgi:hypothetical protein
MPKHIVIPNGVLCVCVCVCVCGEKTFEGMGTIACLSINSRITVSGHCPWPGILIN